MVHFYELYLYGDELAELRPYSPARALRLAQCWLRDVTNDDLLKEMLPVIRQKVRSGDGDVHPYADPYHWAAFVYYGAM
jgi:CHAT domain-containing protein